MATVTPNYNWPIPTNTDYVKDGANSIADLGDAIDATVFALPSGGLTFIKKVDFSAANTIDFSNSFSATYDNYFVIGTYTSSADGDLNFRYRVGGEDNSTSNYNLQVFDVSSTSSTSARVTNATAARLAPTRASTTRISFKSDLYNPFLAATKQTINHSAVFADTGIIMNQSDTNFNATTSFTGLTIFPSAGTVTGTIRIFGYQNS